MRYTKMVFILTMLSTMSSNVLANTVGEWSRTQNKTMLYQAQIAEQEAINKLEELRNGPVSSPVASNNIGMDMLGVSQGSSSPSSSRVFSEPMVLSILGSGKDTFATFLIGENRRIEGRAGNTLPGGYEVVSVNEQRVLLKKDGKTFTAAQYQ